MTSAYRSTSVPVERSKESIRQLLIKFGARGVQFAEDFETREINVRFAKSVNNELRTVSVTMIAPEPPQPKRKKGAIRWYRGEIVYNKTPVQRQEQMNRATYRALHYWLKSQFEAIEFGLFKFEDVFLSHFEWMIDGQRTTVGKLIVPRLTSDHLLPAPQDFIEGELSD